MGSHLHCSVLARVDGRVITTTSGSMYVLDDLDRRVATVIDYILKNTIGAPDYDHYDPLNPYMMDLQAFAGKLVYEQPDFPVTDVLAGISLLTNNSMGSVFSRAQPEYKLESFQNMVEMARMFALNCNFSINMVADMPKLQGVNYNHPRFKRYSRSLNLLAPANITLRQLLVQFYQLNPESLALTTYHTNLGKFLQLVPEAQTENWVHSCLGLAGDVGNRVKVVWNEGGSGAGDVGPVSGGADLGDVLERTLAELGFRAQEEVKVVGV